jgi:hypothetical protein
MEQVSTSWCKIKFSNSLFYLRRHHFYYLPHFDVRYCRCAFGCNRVGFEANTKSEYTDDMKDDLKTDIKPHEKPSDESAEIDPVKPIVFVTHCISRACFTKYLENVVPHSFPSNFVC